MTNIQQYNALVKKRMETKDKKEIKVLDVERAKVLAKIKNEKKLL